MQPAIHIHADTTLPAHHPGIPPTQADPTPNYHRIGLEQAIEILSGAPMARQDASMLLERLARTFDEQRYRQDELHSVLMAPLHLPEEGRDTRWEKIPHGKDLVFDYLPRANTSNPVRLHYEERKIFAERPRYESLDGFTHERMYALWSADDGHDCLKGIDLGRRRAITAGANISIPMTWRVDRSSLEPVIADGQLSSDGVGSRYAAAFAALTGIPVLFSPHGSGRLYIFTGTQSDDARYDAAVVTHEVDVGRPGPTQGSRGSVGSDRGITIDDTIIPLPIGTPRPTAYEPLAA